MGIIEDILALGAQIRSLQERKAEMAKYCPHERVKYVHGYREDHG